MLEVVFLHAPCIKSSSSVFCNPLCSALQIPLFCRYPPGATKRHLRLHVTHNCRLDTPPPLLNSFLKSSLKSSAAFCLTSHKSVLCFIILTSAKRNAFQFPHWRNNNNKKKSNAPWLLAQAIYFVYVRKQKSRKKRGEYIGFLFHYQTLQPYFHHCTVK